ncbi:hypothetical protein GCM10010517_08270 [Streptosporangium fragile]|uniref:Uncharacterized protein n=1 Tax=Streptosporangium fragile TaxID=46186 RepID=A0ABN3VQS4_9ACTN
MTSPEEPALKRPQFCEEAAERAERQLATLRQDFPGWDIVCVTDLAVPIWYAISRTPPTDRQRIAGVHETFIRSSAEELAKELAAQVELVHRTRAAHTFGP